MDGQLVLNPLSVSVVHEILRHEDIPIFDSHFNPIDSANFGTSDTNSWNLEFSQTRFVSLWLKIIKQILDLTLYPLWDLDESSDFQALHSNKFECRVLSSCSYFTGSVLRKNNKNLLSFKVKHQILRQSQKHWSIHGIFLTNSIHKFY